MQLIIDVLTGIREDNQNFMSTVNTGMAALTQAVADQTAMVAALTTAVKGIETGLTNALALLKASDADPAVKAAAAQLEASISQVNALTAGLNSATAAIPAGE